jgi:hypothetical protein
MTKTGNQETPQPNGRAAYARPRIVTFTHQPFAAFDWYPWTIIHNVQAEIERATGDDASAFAPRTLGDRTANGMRTASERTAYAECALCERLPNAERTQSVGGSENSGEATHG